MLRTCFSRGFHRAIGNLALAALLFSPEVLAVPLSASSPDNGAGILGRAFRAAGTPARFLQWPEPWSTRWRARQTRESG